MQLQKSLQAVSQQYPGFTMMQQEKSKACASSHTVHVALQAVAAHICYVLAGLHIQPCDPVSQLCLVGGDHRTCPRQFATVSALQRSEVLEWARSQGQLSTSFAADVTC